MYEKPILWQSSSRVFKQAVRAVSQRASCVLALLAVELLLIVGLARIGTGPYWIWGAFALFSLYELFLALVVTYAATDTQPRPAAALMAQALRRLPAAAAVAIVLAVSVTVGTILLVVPGIILYVFTALSLFVLALEPVSAGEAIRTSIRLVRGWWWRVCSRLIFVMAIAMILTFISVVPVIGAPVSYILSLLLTPVIVAFLALTYRELAEKKRLLESAPVSVGGKLAIAFYGIIVLLALVGASLLREVVTPDSTTLRLLPLPVSKQMLLHDDGTVTEEVLPLAQ